MNTAAKERAHATCLAFGPFAVLLRGPSGAGKSDLCLRCLDLACAAGCEPRLVADDQVLIEARGGRAFASAPEPLKGLIEIRGLGIVEMDYLPEAEICLVCDLVPPDEVPRMPPEPPEAVFLAGVGIPLITLSPFDASAPLKVSLAVRRAVANSRSEAQERACAAIPRRQR